MLTHSFEARVVNGQLVPAEPLRNFEGQQVRVTLMGASAPAAAPVPLPPNGAPEPPADLDVEKEVYVPMPLRREVVANPIIEKGDRLPPCLILPEVLPDD